MQCECGREAGRLFLCNPRENRGLDLIEREAKPIISYQRTHVISMIKISSMSSIRTNLESRFQEFYRELINRLLKMIYIYSKKSFKVLLYLGKWQIILVLYFYIHGKI